MYYPDIKAPEGRHLDYVPIENITKRELGGCINLDHVFETHLTFLDLYRTGSTIALPNQSADRCSLV